MPEFPGIGAVKYRALKYFRKALSDKTRVYSTGKRLVNAGRINQKWVFHDERWVRIIDRAAHRKLVFAGRPLNIADNLQGFTDEVRFNGNNEIIFDGITKNKDEWLYLFLDPLRFSWNDFSWQFSVCKRSHFRELQFGFRYIDFYNRYRFRFEDNKICFDKVWKGRFFNNVSVVDFSMQLGVFYKIRIDVCDNNFKLFVNGKLLMDEYDFDDLFPSGSIAVILWENNGKTDIKGRMGDMNVYELL